MKPSDLAAQKKAATEENQRRLNAALAAASDRTKGFYTRFRTGLKNAPRAVILFGGTTTVHLSYATAEERVADLPEVNAALDILRIAGWPDPTVGVGDDLTTIVMIPWAPGI